MNQRKPQPPEIPEREKAPRPDVDRRPGDEEQPGSHPDLERDRPPVTEVDRDPADDDSSEGIAAGLREDYDDATKS